MSRREATRQWPAWQLGGLVGVTIAITALWATEPSRMSAVGIAGLCGMWASAGAILQKNSGRVMEMIRRV